MCKSIDDCYYFVINCSYLLKNIIYDLLLNIYIYICIKKKKKLE